MSGARIASLGIALPEREVTSKELGTRLEVSESWIVDRTGIHSRRVAADCDTAATLGTRAAHDALGGRSDIDLIICATLSGEARFPATGCLIGAALGTTAPAYDVNAGCSGFLFALAQAGAAIDAGLATTVLVVGAEVMSRIVDPDDVKTSILFGDGAGAAVVERSPATALGPFQLFSDGSRPELLTTDEGGLVQMEGREVFRAAVTAMTASVQCLIDKEGIATTDVDLVIAHQANQRILDAVATRLNLSEDQVFSNISRYGNTSGASIPLALYEAERDGRMRDGDHVVLTAFGAGFCWGAGSVHWTPTWPSRPRLLQEVVNV